MRLKTNNIAFSPRGVIVYPLKTNLEARKLPWFELEDLPFVVVIFRDKLGVVHEATIDMENIRKAKDFMSSKMKCPILGTERYF